MYSFLGDTEGLLNNLDRNTNLRTLLFLFSVLFWILSACLQEDNMKKNP